MLTKSYNAGARHISLEMGIFMPVYHPESGRLIAISGYSPIVAQGKVGQLGIPKDILALRPTWNTAQAVVCVSIHHGRVRERCIAYWCSLLIEEKNGESKQISSKKKHCGIEDLWLGKDNAFVCDPRNLDFKSSDSLDDTLRISLFSAVILRMQLSLRISTEKDLVWIEAVPKNHLTIQMVTTRYLKSV